MSFSMLISVDGSQFGSPHYAEPCMDGRSNLTLAPTTVCGGLAGSQDHLHLGHDQNHVYNG